MNNDLKKKFQILVYSIIPLSIIIGPAISFLNTLIICILILSILLIEIKFSFYKSQVLLGLFFLYFYLIFNSFISVDISSGIYRNFGFVRFIFYFIAFNYIFHYYKNSKNILKIWLITFLVLVIDVYIERITGSNILGFGKIEIDGVIQADGDRVMSFFKDEAISGAFIAGFIFIVSGYIFSSFKKNDYSKIFSFLIISFFFIGILITGERSNSLKVTLGLFIFILIIDYIKFRTKFLIFGIFISIFFLAITFSDYLKMRYYGQIYLTLIEKEARSKFFNHFYFELYKSGYSVFENYPLFGVGNKNYRVETCDREKKEKNLKYACNTHPHQIYFELLSEHGILGTIIILSIIFYLTFRLLKIILLSQNYIQAGAFSYILINFIPVLPSGAFFNDFNLTLFMINFSIMYAVNDKTNIFSNKKN